MLEQRVELVPNIRRRHRVVICGETDVGQPLLHIRQFGAVRGDCRGELPKGVTQGCGVLAVIARRVEGQRVGPGLLDAREKPDGHRQRVRRGPSETLRGYKGA